MHRGELTALERSEHISAWIKIKDSDGVSAQVAPKPKGGRPEGGINAATRELGIDRTEAQRAIKVASIAPEAKAAAIAAGMDNNQSAMLKV